MQMYRLNRVNIRPCSQFHIMADNAAVTELAALEGHEGAILASSSLDGSIRLGVFSIT